MQISEMSNRGHVQKRSVSCRRYGEYIYTYMHHNNINGVHIGTIIIQCKKFIFRFFMIFHFLTKWNACSRKIQLFDGFIYGYFSNLNPLNSSAAGNTGTLRFGKRNVVIFFQLSQKIYNGRRSCRDEFKQLHLWFPTAYSLNPQSIYQTSP